MTAAILSGRRRVPPYGMAGGGPGALGETWVERVGGARDRLGYAEQTELAAGDVFVVATPSGGGYGAAPDALVPGVAQLPDGLALVDDRRGMLSLFHALPPGSPAERAAEALLAVRERLLICTGFAIDGQSETDGPPGAVALARALRQLGRDVAIVSWPEALAAWAPVLDDLPTIAIGRGGPSAALAGRAITIEVCGRTASGSYITMDGRDIVAEAPWFESAIGAHALVSIGDGGNEYGFGAAPGAWFAAHRVAAPSSTCDVLVVGQVSNWAALAVVAALARSTGASLLPTGEAYQAQLELLAARGVVDGLTRRAEPTEDGFPRGFGMRVIEALQHWTRGATPGSRP